MLFTFTLEGVSFNLFFLLLWEAEKKKEKILMNGFWGKNGKGQKSKKIKIIYCFCGLSIQALEI